jgi:TRAP-type C4-dicarboxylate transport system permease large subunit
MVLGVTIGLLTPPVGLILFIVAQIAEIRVDQMIRAIIPFLVPLIAVLVLLAIFPWLSLALPSFLYSL